MPTDADRLVRRLRRLRAVAACSLAGDAFAIPACAAEGVLVVAYLAVAAMIAALAMLLVETRAIRSLERLRSRGSLARPYLAPSPLLAGTSMAGVGAGMARLASALGGCAHPDAEPVDLLVTGEAVAWWCEGCGTQLPAEWSPPEPSRKPCDCRRCVTGSQWWPVCERHQDGGPR
jgi:hypothetical protein